MGLIGTFTKTPVFISSKFQYSFSMGTQAKQTCHKQQGYFKILNTYTAWYTSYGDVSQELDPGN